MPTTRRLVWKSLSGWVNMRLKMTYAKNFRIDFCGKFNLFSLISRPIYGIKFKI